MNSSLNHVTRFVALVTVLIINFVDYRGMLTCLNDLVVVDVKLESTVVH